MECCSSKQNKDRYKKIATQTYIFPILKQSSIFNYTIYLCHITSKIKSHRGWIMPNGITH